MLTHPNGGGSDWIVQRQNLYITIACGTERMTLHRLPLLALSLVGLLAACASSPPPPDTRSTEQVVAQTSGRKLSINDNVRQGLQFAIAPIASRCRRDGGTLTDEKLTDVQFFDRRGAQRPRSVSLPALVVCQLSDRFAWGVDLRIAEAQYLVAGSIGDGVNYYGTVLTEFMSGDFLQAESKRIATDRENERRSDEAYSRECDALREAYNRRVQSNPTVGMKVRFGMIIELRGSIALVQYDAFGRQVKQKDQEWVPVSSLLAGENCPH
jgi:hypothetical protein